MKRAALPDIQDDIQASVPSSEQAFTKTKRKRRKKKRVRKQPLLKVRHVSPGLLFAILFAMSFVILFAFPSPTWAAITCSLIGIALYVDDRYSFSWSSSIRRSYKIRNNFSRIESVMLIVMFCFLALLAFQYWVFELSWRKINWNVFELRWPF